jgi:hypothetical protein
MAETAPAPAVDGGFAAHAAAERRDAEYRRGEDMAEGLHTPAQEFDINASPLNDTAEFHVYGSRGRTYHALDGSGDVIADADHVIPSWPDQIRRDESLHPDPQVRARYAKSYMNSIEDLTQNQGLELYQAERITDARLSDTREVFNLTGKFMDGEEKGGRFDPNNGPNGKRTPDNAEMEGNEARRRALDIYQRKDAARVRAARLENPHTRADEQARIAAEAAQRRGNRDEMAEKARGRAQRKQEGRERARNESRGGAENTDAAYAEAFALNEELDRALEAVPHRNEDGQTVLGESGDNYARVTAEQRSGHLGRLQQGRRFGRRMTRRSNEADDRTTAAREDFEGNLAQFADVYRRANGGQAYTERRLLEHHTGSRYSLQRNIMLQREDYARGNGNLRDRAAGFIGRHWSGNRTGRFFKVAIPAAALGAALPVVGVFLGYKAGQGIAGAENRRRVTDQNFSRGLFADEVQVSQQGDYAIDIDTLLASGQTVDNVDFTQSIEDTTTQQVEQNRRRREVAGRVGVLAAAAGSIASAFPGVPGGINVAHHFINGAHQAAAHGHHAAQGAHGAHGGHPGAHDGHPGGHGGHGGHNGGGENPTNVNPDQAPWSVAHQMAPGHEFQTMHATMNQLNHQFNMHLHYVTQPDGKIWIENGGKALNHAQQLAFNRIMEGLGSSVS